MEIMDYEIKRHTQWSEDIAHKKIKDDAKGQIISECLFDFLNFPKNHRKI